MKTRLNLLLIAVLVFCSACTTTKNEQRLRDTVDEIAMYLTNNYDVGDCIVFVQDGMTEQMWTVTHNQIDTLRVVDEPENEYDPLTYTEEYYIKCTIKSTANTIKMTWCPFISAGRTCHGVRVTHSDEYSTQTAHPKITPFNIFDTTNGELLLHENNSNFSCTLKRNVGIIKFSNGEHTWRLKE